MEDPSRCLIFALASSPGFVRVRDARALSSIPNETEVLSLESVPVGDTDLTQLPPFPQLRCLDLDGTRITDVTLAWVARHPKLEELWIESTAVTDSGLTKLAQLPRLAFVSAAYSGVTEEGAEKLRASLPGVMVSG